MMTCRRRFRLCILTLVFVVVGMLATSSAMGSVIRYDEDSSGITYGPSPWQTFSWQAGKAYRYTQLQNATCDFAFTGTGVSCYDSKGTVFGIAQIWVDSEPPVLVDLYNAGGTLREQLLFTRTGLAPGNHVLHIRNTGTKNPASANYQIGVDYFEVFAPSTITASAGAGGSISPSGGVSVDHGGSQTFAISADSGYRVSDVLVDGSSVGTVASYTFSGVTGPHTISASFESVPVASTPASSGWSLGLLATLALGLTLIEARRRSLR